ncbi:hypothetical protein SDJN03_25796, partial [Cucurbita argyrosperma subsp. sororia]
MDLIQPRAPLHTASHSAGGANQEQTYCIDTKLSEGLSEGIKGGEEDDGAVKRREWEVKNLGEEIWRNENGGKITKGGFG